MGRTSKWLRILLGGKKDPKQFSVAAEKECHGSEVPMMTSKDKEKRRWSIGRSSKDRHQSCEDMSWAAPPTGHRYAENSNSVFDSQQQQQQDKSKHAGAVAAVRLADNNDCIISSYGVTKITAAIRIQALFRGYLARRALRALKALVKLQALVRGFLVRKQADATLYCMRSLIRVQARARANRLSSCNSERVRSSSIQQRQQQHQSHEHRPRKAMLQEGSNLHEETVAAYTQSRRSFTFQQQDLPEDTAKVVEVDNVKHRRQSAGRRNISASDSSISSAFSPGPNYMSHPSLYSPGPASDELSANLLQDQLNSPMVTVKPGRGFNGFTRDTDCRYHIEDYKTSSVQSSPRLCARKNTAAAMSSNGALTPSRSDYSQGFPHYMANTESSRAKVRSQSAPKQRPPAAEKSSSCGGRKRVPLQETTMQVQSRQSFSGFDAAKEECKSHQNHRKLQGATLSFRDTTTWERFHSFW